jgi:hypothetical protein
LKRNIEFLDPSEEKNRLFFGDKSSPGIMEFQSKERKSAIP